MIELERNILLLIDPDEDAEDKLKFTQRLAETTKSSVILLSNVQSRELNFSDKEEKQKIRYLRLRELIEEYETEGSFKRSAVVVGDLFESLYNIDIQEDIHLFVMGLRRFRSNRGDNGERKLERMMRTLDCPVVLLKEPFHDTSIRDIGFLMDDIDLDYEKGIQYLVDFSNSIHARLHLLVISDPEKINAKDGLNRIIEVAEKYQPDSYSINSFVDSNIFEGMVFLTKKKKIDMVAISSQTLKANTEYDNLVELFNRLDCHIIWQHSA